MIWLFVILILLFLVAGWLFAHRDPERTIIPSRGYLSPADGIVIAVHDVQDTKAFIKKKDHGITAFLDDFPEGATIIVIMMKFWHVHTQRAPTNCIVNKITYKKGTFANAVFGDYNQATIENEHMAYLLKGKKSCKVYLIAGLVARRIISIVEEGMTVKQGERIGKIAFGSQVALVIPKAAVTVNVGDRVYAGITEVAR